MIIVVASGGLGKQGQLSQLNLPLYLRGLRTPTAVTALPTLKMKKRLRVCLLSHNLRSTTGLLLATLVLCFVSVD